jgi:hypothetical protein
VRAVPFAAIAMVLVVCVLLALTSEPERSQLD